MTKKTLSYNGYTGSIDVCVDDDCLLGKILFIEDLITYEGETPGKLEAGFRDAVDRYIAYCEKSGKSPNKPYSGTFNVRVGEDLHRASCVAAAESGLNLNEFVCLAISDKLAQAQPLLVKEVHHHHYQAQNSYNEDSAQQWHDQSPNQVQMPVRH